MKMILKMEMGKFMQLLFKKEFLKKLADAKKRWFEFQVYKQFSTRNGYELLYYGDIPPYCFLKKQLGWSPTEVYYFYLDLESLRHR